MQNVLAPNIQMFFFAKGKGNWQTTNGEVSAVKVAFTHPI
jgi:hypothetical protein